MQIIAESFPISSSGHVQLLAHFLKNGGQRIGACTDMLFEQGIYPLSFLESFDHVLHGITLILLAFFFYNRWKLYIIRIHTAWSLFFKAVCFTALADVCTAFFYLLFKMHPIHLPLCIGFLITACALLSLFWITKAKPRHLNVRIALILGVVQGLALLPGISRLACTYVAARWLGLQSRLAFEVSWLIAVLLFMAACMQGIYALGQMHEMHSLLYAAIPYMACATFVAFCALKTTAYLFYTQRGWWFGIYMMLPLLLTWCV